METRKVQVTGGSTYTVSLPKSWARERGVSGGSVVELFPEADALVVTPRRSETKTVGELAVDDRTGDALARAVTTMYVSGFDVVELTATQITAAQRRTVRDAAQRLVGLEVIEETGQEVRLRDLLDPAELSVHDATTRMRLVATSMLADAVTALVEGDADLASDVVARDDDLDRLYAMVVRVFRSTLRSPAVATEVGVDRETCYDYQTVARQFERIGDHAEKVARQVPDVAPVDEARADAVTTLHREAANTVETATAAFFADDAETTTRKADAVRRHTADVAEQVREFDTHLQGIDPERAQRLRLVVDSLSRSADYGENVAEAALQRATPTP